MPISIMITCVGGCNIDVKTKSTGKLILHSSNPVRSVITAGGVARNIAENLLRLGIDVQLISRVGEDPYGRWLLQHLADTGINNQHIGISKTFPTATYRALLDHNGEMFIAMAEMDIYNELTPGLLNIHRDALFQSDTVIVDTNLSSSAIGSIASHKAPTSQLWAVAASVHKVKLLETTLPQLTGILVNRDEFLALTHGTDPVDFQVDLKHECRKLISKGLKALVITDGKNGVYLATQTQFMTFRLRQKLEEIEDVTGAGDALASGFFLGLSLGYSLEDSIPLGLAAARLTLSTPSSVNTCLTRQVLLELVSKGAGHLFEGQMESIGPDLKPGC